LSFTCPLATAGYDWTVPPFLNGTQNNGRVIVGEAYSVRGFKVAANGYADKRRSTLLFSASTELVGERTVKCEEPGALKNYHYATITVLCE